VISLRYIYGIEGRFLATIGGEPDGDQPDKLARDLVRKTNWPIGSLRYTITWWRAAFAAGQQSIARLARHRLAKTAARSAASVLPVHVQRTRTNARHPKVPSDRLSPARRAPRIKFFCAKTKAEAADSASATAPAAACSRPGPPYSCGPAASALASA